MRKLVLLFCALVGLFFTGSATESPVRIVLESNRITVFVSNETDEVIEDVFIRWGSKYYWGEHLRYFEEIQPGEKVKFTILTDIGYEDKDVSTSLDMSYKWQGNRLNFWRFVWQINQQENATWDFRLQGAKAITPVINPNRHSLLNPGEESPKYGPTNIEGGYPRFDRRNNWEINNELSKEEILCKAITEMDKCREKGFHERYIIDSITEKEEEWIIFFEGKITMIGNHALVWVSKDGKKVRYAAGK